MRDFIWGIVVGAVAMYWYTFYGDSLSDLKYKLDLWRDTSVSETSGYAPGPKKK